MSAGAFDLPQHLGGGFTNVQMSVVQRGTQGGCGVTAARSEPPECDGGLAAKPLVRGVFMERVQWPGANGRSFESARHSINPLTDTTVTTTVQVFSVSFSVNPLNLPTTQNPLSFIQEKIIAP